MLRGPPKRFRDRAVGEESRMMERARASDKAARATYTYRQRSLERHKKRTRSRHRTEYSESLPAISIRAKGRDKMPEIGGDTHASNDEIDNTLGESNESAVTLSLTLDPSLEDYAVRLVAIPPDGGRTHFVKGRLDHGCPICVINMNVVDRLRLQIRKLRTPINVEGIFGLPERCRKYVVLLFRIHPWPRVFKAAFLVLEKHRMKNDALFGRKFLERRLQIRTNQVWRAITTAPPAEPSA